MSKLLLAVLAVVFAFTIRAADPYDRVKERARLLSALDSVTDQTVAFYDFDKAPEAHRTFLVFFRERILPTLSNKRKFTTEKRILNVACDRALFNDEAEHAAWNARIVALDNELNTIDTDPRWKETVARWAELGAGLSGYLPSFARNLQRAQELGDFSVSEMALLQRLSAVEVALRNIQNTSPVAPHLKETEKIINDTVARFFSRELTFAQAWAAIEARAPLSQSAMGQDVALRGRELFQEMAILRTDLARSKGYANWSQYQVAVQSLQYTDAFNSVEQRIAFLRQLLKQTEMPYLRFLRLRLSTIPDAETSLLRASQQHLLSLPSDPFVRPYLNLEHATTLWREVMLENGFSPEHLSRIHWDSLPRMGKQTHAYMENAVDPTLRVLKVNARELNVGGWQADNVTSANIQIVQNLRDNGVGAFSVTLHEGGHGLDFAARRSPLGEDGSNAWAETHSFLMEEFLQEPEYLIRAAALNGRQMPETAALAYIQNSAVNELMHFRRQVALALFDLEMWNESYDEDSSHFVDRSSAKYAKIMWDALRLRAHVIDGQDPKYGCFSTSHFTSGEVRYIGYVLAYVSANQTQRYFLDLFGRQSTRRSLMRQPGMASLLVDHYYKGGALYPFPVPVEKLTGEVYNPDAYVADLIRRADNYTPGPNDYTVAECAGEVAAQGVAEGNRRWALGLKIFKAR